MKQALRITAQASELSQDQRFCTCCQRPLARKFAWLELDQRTQHYHDRGGVPSDESQGFFPFGMTCAAQEVSRYLRATAHKNFIAETVAANQ